MQEHGQQLLQQRLDRVAFGCWLGGDQPVALASAGSQRASPG